MAIKVFISHNYSDGDKNSEEIRELNVETSILIANKLIDLGYIPINPLLFHFHDKIFKQDYSVWMKICKEYICMSDCVLMMGYSIGCKEEFEFCKSINKPVYFSVEELELNCVWDV